MEHNNSESITGPVSAILSVITSILAWISIKDVQVIFGIIASCAAIGSGFYAIKYYRKQLKK